MRNLPGLFAALVLGAGTMFLTGCGQQGGAPGSGGSSGGDVIAVGEYASLTGKEAAFGQSSHKGTQLAIEELNAAGGVLGKQLKLITEDTQSKGGESATVVKKLISRDKVVAVLGEVASGRSLEAAPLCQANNIPMISPSSTNPEVTKKGDYIFRVCFTDDFQAKVLAAFGRKNLNLSKVAILEDAAAPYSVGLASFFRNHFKEAGGQLVAEQRYSSGDKDFRAQLTAIRASNPEGLFVPGYYTEVGLIVLQARQLGMDLPIFGGDGWEAPQLIEIAGDSLKNTFYSTHFFAGANEPRVQEFVKKYQAKFGGETPDAMGALGYDSALVLADAIKRAGTTEGPKLRDALAQTKDFPGAAGTTTIDAERNASKGAVIITVENGKFKHLETVTP